MQVNGEIANPAQPYSFFDFINPPSTMSEDKYRYDGIQFKTFEQMLIEAGVDTEPHLKGLTSFSKWIEGQPRKGTFEITSTPADVNDAKGHKNLWTDFK